MQGVLETAPLPVFRLVFFQFFLFLLKLVEALVDIRQQLGNLFPLLICIKSV